MLIRKYQLIYLYVKKKKKKKNTLFFEESQCQSIKKYILYVMLL